MKDFKSFSAVMRHEIEERGYESEKKEGHGDLKGHPSIEQIAKKHNIDPIQVISQIKKGYKLEKEHTNNIDMAIDIAIQHVNEFPTYYDELIKMEAKLKKSHKKFKDNPIKESMEDNKRMLRGERYCPLCKKFETQSECSYGPNIWNKFSISTVHPTNEEKTLANSNPCWKGYKPVGTKKKGGKTVPNCVPKSGDQNESQQLLSFNQFCKIAENFQFNIDPNQVISIIDEDCWKGYKQVGMKKKGKKIVPNCVPKEDYVPEARTVMSFKPHHYSYSERGTPITPEGAIQHGKEVVNRATKERQRRNLRTKGKVPIKDGKPMFEDKLSEASPAWQKKEGKNPEGGLNKKGIASYRKEHPGSKLSLAVTTPPSKLDPDSKAAKRRKSFCARMGGMPGPMKDEKGRPTRKALSLRKWNC